MTINLDVLIPNSMAAMDSNALAIFSTLVRNNVPQRIGIRNPKKPEKFKYILTLTVENWGKYKGAK